MAEIHLPTKVTQDSIKIDTQFIRGQFPISSGTNISDLRFMTNYSEPTVHLKEPILDIQGKGILYTISTSSSANFVVEIDGQKHSVRFKGAGTIPFFCGFNSIKITSEIHFSGTLVTYNLG